VQDGENVLENRSGSDHKCRCSECIERPSGKTALLHTCINCLVVGLDEKNHRQFMGLLASQFGHGGIQYYPRPLDLVGIPLVVASKKSSERMLLQTDVFVALLGVGATRQKKRAGLDEST